MSHIIIPGRAAKGTRPSGPFSINLESPQAQNLVGWWPFSGGWTNVVSRAPMTRAGGIGLAGAPVVGQCLVCDGSDDSATAPDEGAFDAVAVSASIWVRSASNDQGVLIGRYDNTAAGSSWMLWRNGGNVLAYVGNATFGGNSLDTGFAGTDDRWHLYAMDAGNNFLRFYLDGQLYASGSGAGGDVPSNATPVTFGTATGLGFATISGLADARLYNRVLTAQEHWALYDPATRWDLYWQPSTRIYFDLAASPPATPTRMHLPLLGVA